jgi:hypothetical protein
VAVDVAGADWGTVSPWGSPRALMAWIVAFVALEKTGDAEQRLSEALAEVYSAPMSEILDSLAEADNTP